MRIAGVVACAVFAAFGTAAAGPPAVQTAVADVLTRSAAAWNRGDLDGFMDFYEDSSQTVYVSATSLVRGFSAIRAHYAGRYRRGHMGRLHVSDLVVRPLGIDYAGATARWNLSRSAGDGGDASGLFSLILHRDGGHWRIISDHTP